MPVAPDAMGKDMHHARFGRTRTGQVEVLGPEIGVAAQEAQDTAFVFRIVEGTGGICPDPYCRITRCGQYVLSCMPTWK